MQAATPAATATDARRLGFTTTTVGAVVVALVASAIVGPQGAGYLLFGLLAVAALDAVVAVQATRRPVVTGRVHPCDVVVGDPFAFEVRVGRSPFPVLLYQGTGTTATIVRPPAAGTMGGRADTRGVVQSLLLTTFSSGLCGLVTCSRSHRVPLGRPLVIGPRPVPPGASFPALGGGPGDGTTVATADGDLVRGLRDYQPGDRLRQVHWRATAHTGELIVKETEESQAPVLHLVLDLGAGGEAGEAAAGRSAWYAIEALGRGYQVILTTVEDGHPLTDGADSVLRVSRRLAQAGPGAPPRPRAATRGVRVLVVSDGGDEWGDECP